MSRVILGTREAIRHSLAGDNYYGASDFLPDLDAFDKNRWKFFLILQKSKTFRSRKTQKNPSSS